jgi:hypothetical protein
MTKEQEHRVRQVVDGIQAALDRGVEHFDRSGKRLGSLSAVLQAWMQDGGLTIKDPRNDEMINTWIHQ